MDVLEGCVVLWCICVCVCCEGLVLVVVSERVGVSVWVMFVVDVW